MIKKRTRIVCVTLICSLLLPIQSASVKAADNNGSELSEEISSLADFEAVDELIEQRVDAMTDGDMSEYHELTEELEAHGCEDVSAQEVQELTGETSQGLLNSQIQSRNNISVQTKGLYSAAASNVTFSKSITNVSYGGKSYKVMKITASPKGRGTLFNTGSVTQKYNSSIKAGSLNLLKIVAKKAGSASNVIKLVSLYDTVCSVIRGFKSTTKVEGVEANYTWTVEEICSFIYVYDARVKNYRISASYNKAKYVVSMNLPYLKVKNGKSYSGITHKQYSDWISAQNYGKTDKAISCFKQGTTYNSWVYNVSMAGCKGKNIKNVYLQHPESAMTLGYWN